MMNEEAEQEEFVERENKKNIFISREMEQSDVSSDRVEKMSAESRRGHESDAESESRGDIEPDSLNYDEASQNQERSNRGDDFDEYDDDDDAEYDDDDDDDEYDDIADEVADDHECQNFSGDEDEHWYNGPVSGEYLWQPYSEDDNTKGEYVWQPIEKTTEPYWGNRNKKEEWIPQEVKKTKNKKGWKPRLIASKEMGETVWYYKLPSTSETAAAQRKSLKHISQLIKDKGNQRWFSQMVSTKDKKKKTVWYCKLTPVDADRQVNGTDVGSTTITEAMNFQVNEAGIIKENPEEIQQVNKRVETGSNEEKLRKNHQNPDNRKTITQASQETPTKTKNSAMVALNIENPSTKLESAINLPKTAVKKPSSEIHENTIPKMIQIQIWNKKPAKKDREALLPSDPKEGAKGSWLPKLGKTHKDMRTTLSNEESQKEKPKQMENFLGQKKSHTGEDKPQKATAIWYEDTSED